MKITITFDSWEEVESFRQPAWTSGYLTTTPVETIKTEPTPVETIKIEPAPVETTVTHTAAPESVTAVLNADTVAAVTAPDYELLRLEVRSTLAELNKTRKGKPAQKLIADMGYKGLTEVPGERLQELMDKAKEMM